jgi:transcriptional regulator with GAF, ATPase, and Fis domain
MWELFADLERLAPSTLSVLLEGETGSGKDVIAESIHPASGRSDGPYVVFDCGAVAPTLVESELFGHERGAFTGATSARRGVFEEASGGTLFLDEIGELPRELQPKLLRALEAQSIKRLGGRAPIAIHVRVISAANRNLMTEVARGQFRQDLCSRLAARPARAERRHIECATALRAIEHVAVGGLSFGAESWMLGGQIARVGRAEDN